MVLSPEPLEYTKSEIWHHMRPNNTPSMTSWVIFSEKTPKQNKRNETENADWTVSSVLPSTSSPSAMLMYCAHPFSLKVVQSWTLLNAPQRPQDGILIGWRTYQAPQKSGITFINSPMTIVPLMHN